MEQVAEALKAIKFANPDQNGWTFNYDMLKEVAHHASDEDLSMEEVESVLLRIIDLYAKKAPVTEWHNRTEDSEFEPNEQYEWEHDITGEVYRESVTIEGVYPNHANKWTDGTYGGYCFESNGVEFKTTEGVRGIEYKALVAFDRKGRGIVFFCATN